MRSAELQKGDGPGCKSHSQCGTEPELEVRLCVSKFQPYPHMTLSGEAVKYRGTMKTKLIPSQPGQEATHALASEIKVVKSSLLTAIAQFCRIPLKPPVYLPSNHPQATFSNQTTKNMEELPRQSREQREKRKEMPPSRPFHCSSSLADFHFFL